MFPFLILINLKRNIDSHLPASDIDFLNPAAKVVLVTGN